MRVIGYGGDTGSTRYSPLDQINASNFNKLEVAWRFKTDNLGPRPDFNMQAVPIVVNGVMYVTSANECYALDAGAGREIWHYRRPRTKDLVGKSGDLEVHYTVINVSGEPTTITTVDTTTSKL